MRDLKCETWNVIWEMWCEIIHFCSVRPKLCRNCAERVCFCRKKLAETDPYVISARTLAKITPSEVMYFKWSSDCTPKYYRNRMQVSKSDSHWIAETKQQICKRNATTLLDKIHKPLTLSDGPKQIESRHCRPHFLDLHHRRRCGNNIINYLFKL